MKANVLVSRIFGIFELCMKLMGAWPVERRNNRYFSIATPILWWFFLLNLLLVLLPNFWTFFVSLNDIPSAIYCIIESTAIAESVFIMIFFKLQHTKLKELLSAIRRHINSKEFEEHLETDSSFVKTFIFLLATYVSLMTIYVGTPKYPLKDRIIIATKYPIPLHCICLKIFLYSNQLIVILHLATVVLTDGLVCLVMYTCQVRLQILRNGWVNVTSDREFGQQVKKHQDILKMIKETNSVVGVLVLKTISSFMCYGICTGLQISEGVTVQTMMQFSLLTFVYIRISINSECSEKIISINDDLQQELFHSLCQDKTPKITAAKNFIIYRSQHFPKIHISGFMCSLDRQYLRKILYATFSYFMTIRAIMST